MRLDADNWLTVDFGKGDGLLPAIVQQRGTGEILMLGFMNRDALRATLERGRAVFFSRSRQRLWEKGETSGHRLNVVAVFADCDRDTLLVVADAEGPTCHLGTRSCFGDDAALATAADFLPRLDRLVRERAAAGPASSYTARLLQAGTRRIAQKVGEEAVEAALAAVGAGDNELLGEAADLLFHLVVLLQSRGLSLAQVTAELARRHANRAKIRDSDAGV
ncbi:MAG: bifunctional phosphoribosyl-AMP cyclohydrolase/phosphoribosyl-ATP diphosphatase HisIE [Steroidobacteraceae bacterium]|nr:bifunctional phosphoribosyl-AMP cyclohydrolase/phosphoribosyl-ATP diphosphatase HisIE [Steroidobacteraceae bacterium]MDW8258560.1 bifunctional phosphoribosyl-AMP cyclohydrolase/phosphoribosyl-ATP diphosphatase HisIE [Gammaproteobacteria bacterium]